MGITKLMHMKESPRCAHDHLRNGINYILDEKKTENGLWVGGNAGTDRAEILESFLETKSAFGKLDGRQGYHFVISFAKGEVDAQTAFNIVKDFCRSYLGDRYDFVFAIHNDKAHMHGHIIFNSVSRQDGLKYHYKDGDWKKFIQPVTDDVCKKYGVSELKFDEQRKGESYAAWLAKQEGRINHRDIVRADIDFAISQSDDMDDFFNIMKKMDYQFKNVGGISRKHGKYFSLQPPHSKRFFRTYTLGRGYNPEEISERILTKNEPGFHEELTDKLRKLSAGYLKPAFVNRTKSGRRLYQAVSYYKLPNPFAVPSARVRKDMQHINRLIQTCKYLKDNNIHDVESLKQRMQEVERQIKLFSAERRSLLNINQYFDDLSDDQKKILDECRSLYNAISKVKSDKEWEHIEDRLNMLQENLPYGITQHEEKIKNLSADLKRLRHEKRLIKSALENESENLQTRLRQPKM